MLIKYSLILESKLAALLARRPTQEKLEHQNIIKQAGWQAARHAAAETLLARLQNRPAQNALLTRGVIAASTKKASPSLHALQRGLKMEQHRDGLARRLRNRQPKSELFRKNILHDPARELSVEAQSQRLAQLFSQRLSPRELHLKGIITGVALWTELHLPWVDAESTANSRLTWATSGRNRGSGSNASDGSAGSQSVPALRSYAPTARNCHAMCRVGETVIITGGLSPQGNVSCQPVGVNIATGSWSLLGKAQTAPLPRYAHACVAVPDGSNMYLFGGYGTNTWLNDTWRFDLSQQTWTLVSSGKPDPAASSAADADTDAAHCKPATADTALATTPAEVPAARAGHTFTMGSDGLAYLFGGNDGTGLFRDLWCFDTLDHSWAQVDASGPPPSARTGHTASYYNRSLYIFGGGTGFGKRCFNDLFVLHLDHEIWTRALWSGECPAPRTGHIAEFVSSNMIVHGGGQGERMYSDMHLLDVTTFAWSKLRGCGEVPTGRAGHASAIIGDTLLVFGGATPTGDCFNDLLALELLQVAPKDASPSGSQSPRAASLRNSVRRVRTISEITLPDCTAPDSLSRSASIGMTDTAGVPPRSPSARRSNSSPHSPDSRGSPTSQLPAALASDQSGIEREFAGDHGSAVEGDGLVSGLHPHRARYGHVRWDPSMDQGPDSGASPHAHSKSAAILHRGLQQELRMRSESVVTAAAPAPGSVTEHTPLVESSIYASATAALDPPTNYVHSNSLVGESLLVGMMSESDPEYDLANSSGVESEPPSASLDHTLNKSVATRPSDSSVSTKAGTIGDAADSAAVFSQAPHASGHPAASAMLGTGGAAAPLERGSHEASWGWSAATPQISMIPQPMSAPLGGPPGFVDRHVEDSNAAGGPVDATDDDHIGSSSLFAPDVDVANGLASVQHLYATVEQQRSENRAAFESMAHLLQTMHNNQEHRYAQLLGHLVALTRHLGYSAL